MGASCDVMDSELDRQIITCEFDFHRALHSFDLYQN